MKLDEVLVLFLLIFAILSELYIVGALTYVIVKGCH